MHWTDYPIYALTYLGSAYVHVVVVALYAWLVSADGGRRLAIALSASFALNIWLKELTMLPRPYEATGAEVDEWVRRSTQGGTTWPSGHAQNTTTLWGFLALDSGRRWRRLWLVAAVVILVVGVLRVVLEVHWVRDVVSGVLIGAAVVWGVGFALPKLPGWDPWLRRLLAVAACWLWTLEGFYPGTGGMVAGALLAQADHRPPGTWRDRGLMVAGGVAATGAAWGAVTGLGAWLGFDPAGPAALAAVLTVLDLWPRAAVRLGIAEPAAEGSAELEGLPEGA